MAVGVDGNDSSDIPNEIPLNMDELKLPVVGESMPVWIPDEKVSLSINPSLQALQRQDKIITDKWPEVTDSAKTEFPDFADTFTKIKDTRAPNFMGAKIPVKSDLIIHEWKKRLVDYHNKLLCKFLEFGWPLGYHLHEPPETTNSDHPSALQHMSHVRKFIQAELDVDAIIGPFHQHPFAPWFRPSPIMTRPKHESDDRRIILDLSFPKGHSVNDGIKILYALPSINDLTDLVKINGPNALMWKADLTRAYRQLRADPSDAPLPGMEVDGKIYINLCPAFGCRSSAALCQRVANALVYI